MNNPTGRETAPHITVRYGLHSQDSAEVLGHIASEQPPYVTIGSSSVFEQEDYDVVKLNVSGESLDALHAKLGELDHTDTHPEYKPHITLAYVKKGEGKKYVGKLNDLNGATITLDSLVFSDGEKTKTTAVLGYTKSSGCGANGPGGGGFKPGNSCASGGKDTGGRSKLIQKYKEAHDAMTPWPDDTSHLSGDEFDSLVARSDAEGRVVRDARNAVIKDIRNELEGKTPEETIKNVDAYERTEVDEQLSTHEESLLNSLKREAENEIMETAAQANETKLRKAMEEVIADGDESVFQNEFQLSHERGQVDANREEMAAAAGNIGFDDRYDEGHEIASLGGMLEGATATLESDDYRQEVKIRIDDGFSAERLIKYENDEIVIENQSLVVYETGNGTGTEILAKQVSHAIEAGVSRIETYAVNGVETNGYYTWPRLGYDAPIPSGVTLPTKFSGVERISQLMMTPEGRDWWKTNGVSTHMTFDLNEGSLSRKVLAAYLKRKGY